MNEVDAKSKPVPGGYHGLLRKVHKARYEPVCENGIAKIFPTALEAENAAWRALRSHLCGDIVGTGERAGRLKIEAEKLFVGKGRVVEQVRR